MKFGKRYVRILMKNTIWNNYGILVIRIGLMSTNIAEVEKPFVVYTQKFHVISFIRIKQDKIISVDEYWSDDGDAPQWRQEMHIGKPIM